MGICINCGRDVIIKNNKFKCDNCGEQTRYYCWDCKSIIEPHNIQPIYEEEKECSWCGFFICPSCQKCGRKKKKNDLIPCERIELKRIILERYQNKNEKTRLSESIQILGNIKQGKYNRYCIKNIPYTYAKTLNKEYLCLMAGWRTRDDNDKKIFQDRYDNIIGEPINFVWTANDKRESGQHPQIIRESCNLGVCLGQVERYKDEEKGWVYKRIEGKKCEYWNEEKIMFKRCPSCKEEFDMNNDIEYCNKCIPYKKGKIKGQMPKLKLKISNIPTCQLNISDFKTEDKNG